MNIINCKICNKPFVRIRSSTCKACEKLEMRNICHINEYTDNNPLATFEEIASSLGLQKSYVKRLQVEGRVRIKDRCQTCGAVINTDKWCSDCKEKLTKSFAERERKEFLEDSTDLLSNKERLALEDRICLDKVSEIEREKHERMYGKRRYGFGVKR